MHGIQVRWRGGVFLHPACNPDPSGRVPRPGRWSGLIRAFLPPAASSWPLDPLPLPLPLFAICAVLPAPLPPPPTIGCLPLQVTGMECSCLAGLGFPPRDNGWPAPHTYHSIAGQWLSGWALPLWDDWSLGPQINALQKEAPPTDHSTASRVVWPSLCGPIHYRDLWWMALCRGNPAHPLQRRQQSSLGFPLWDNGGILPILLPTPINLSTGRWPRPPSAAPLWGDGRAHHPITSHLPWLA